jgi:DNA-binding transcriptional LysR family regulator
MPLSQDQLAALGAVVRAGSFTRAAAELGLSQPALSRRISNLEEQLSAVLLVRSAGGVTVTDAGRRVLAFTRAQQALEDELIGELAPTFDPFRGAVRVAGLSSLVPRVVLPDLAKFLHAHPSVQLEARHLHTDALTAALQQGAVDVAISNVEVELRGIESRHVGDEEFVVIESEVPAGLRDVFLDTDVSDHTTEWFLAAQAPRLRPARWRRCFLDDEAGILLGVQLGLGRAVKPRHTIPARAKVRLARGFAPVRRAVFLQHRASRYQGRLHREVLELIEVTLRRELRPPQGGARRAWPK